MPQPIPTSPFADFLDRTQLGESQSHDALTLWPLSLRAAPARSGDGAREPATPNTPPTPAPYITLGEALESGTLQIDEVDRAGSVPHVRVTNRGPLAVLFLFGEEIVGAKQNRIANASFLVPAASEVVLDVSCVEAGRWSRSPDPSAKFRHSDHVVSHSMRRQMAPRVENARRFGLGFQADQFEVWQGVSSRLQLADIDSGTAAYSDYREGRRSDVARMSQSFHTIDHQVGFVARIGNEIAGLEIIGHPDVFKTDFQPLLRSYAIDAVDPFVLEAMEKAAPKAAKAKPSPVPTPEALLTAVAKSQYMGTASLGAGRDLRLEATNVSGCALYHEDLIHLTAFPRFG